MAENPIWIVSANHISGSLPGIRVLAHPHRFRRKRFGSGVKKNVFPSFVDRFPIHTLPLTRCGWAKTRIMPRGRRVVQQEEHAKWSCGGADGVSRFRGGCV